MKGIILAGGTGSRLYPLTKVTNKHLLPVGKYPMIYWPLYRFVEAGIKDIMIVTGKEHMGSMVGLLGSGSEFGASLTYRVQDNAGGIAEALGLCEDFIMPMNLGEKFAVILGDNIFPESLVPVINNARMYVNGANIVLKKVDDPKRFGVAEINQGKVVNIEEKPVNPKSNYAVTGLYFYNYRVWDYIKLCKPSGRKELEITDVNNGFLNDGNLSYEVCVGEWTDAGTPESMLRANMLCGNIDLKF